MQQTGTLKQLYSRYAQQLCMLAFKIHKQQHVSDQLHLKTIQLETKIASVEKLLMADGQEDYIAFMAAQNARNFVELRNLYDKDQNDLKNGIKKKSDTLVDESTNLSGGSKHTPLNDPAGSGAQRPSDT